MLTPPTKLTAKKGHLRLEQFSPQPGVILDEIMIDADSMTYDIPKARFELGNGKAVVRISENSLRGLIAEQLGPSASDLRVSIQAGDVRVTGKYQMIVGVPFEVRGRMEIKDDTALRFRVLSVNPALAQGIVENNIPDPLFDVADMALPIDLKLKRIDAENGVLELHGTA